MKKKQSLKCKRCGKCCNVLDGEVWIDCPYLIKDSKGFCTCQIFHKRIGWHELYFKDTETWVRWYCGLRKDTNCDYPGCPFNSGLVMHPRYS